MTNNEAESKCLMIVLSCLTKTVEVSRLTSRRKPPQKKSWLGLLSKDG